jgi:dihydroxy-acid dehydratase
MVTTNTPYSTTAPAAAPQRPSDVVYRGGYARAPARSYMRAMGLTDEDLAKPIVGVASCWNEATPCNSALNRMAAWAKQGVSAGGGTPREFTTIAVTDGISMGYEGMKASLVSREVIADSVELMIFAHGYDALLGVGGCDKTIPAMIMAMARLNVPSVFIYGGSILPGTWRGKDVTIQDVFESVGAVEAGRMTEAEQQELEAAACPGDGACGGMYTANTMACASEALGIALPFSASMPAIDSARTELCRYAGSRLMQLLEKGIRPSDILTRQAFENAIAVVVAVGGSTNAALHLPAIAHELGIELTIDDFDTIARRIPHPSHRRHAARRLVRPARPSPGGRYAARDEDFARRGPAARGLPHRHRQDRRREPQGPRFPGSARHERPQRGRAAGARPRACRHDGRAQGQHRAGRFGDEDQRRQEDRSPRPGPRLRH